MSLADKHKKAREEVLEWASTPSLKKGAPCRNLSEIVCSAVSYHSQDHTPVRDSDTSCMYENARRTQEAEIMTKFSTLSAKLMSDEKSLKNRGRYADDVIDHEPGSSALVKKEWEEARRSLRKLANLNRSYVEEGLRLSCAITPSRAKEILLDFSKNAD